MKTYRKGSFRYWFVHCREYNKYARKQGVWKFKYLFHDFDKPWLHFFMTHEKVRKLHKSYSTHHLDYSGPNKIDYDGVIIDWEVSRFTKEEEGKRNALQYLDLSFSKGRLDDEKLYNLVKSVKHVIREFTICIKLDRENWKKYFAGILGKNRLEDEETSNRMVDSYLILEFSENGSKKQMTLNSSEPSGTEILNDEVFYAFYDEVGD